MQFSLSLRLMDAFSYTEINFSGILGPITMAKLTLRTIGTFCISFITVLLIIVSSIIFLPSSIPLSTTDILVYGSSLGGIGAAITAAENGATVILATDSERIGGQAVESGMSAFDDLKQQWELWGIYGDLYRSLFPLAANESSFYSGLGEPIVGRIGAPPDTIEQYFLNRIRSNPRITLLTGYSISNFVQRKRKWSEALLTNMHTAERHRVKFTYLVDGTTTGRILEQTNTPLRLGLDAAEETGEANALPLAARTAFIEGATINGKKYVGLGNRIQAVTSPFVLLDRGYPGIFIPAPLQNTPCALPIASSANLITKTRTVRLSTSGCQMKIPLSPEFDDMYDVFLVQHGEGSAAIALYSSLWPTAPLTRLLYLKKNQELLQIGAFPLSRTHSSVLTITATSGEPLIEGIILVKKNIHTWPVVLPKPASTTVKLADYDTKFVIGDVYLTGTNFPPDITLSIDGKTTTDAENFMKTIKIPHVALRGQPSLLMAENLRSSLSSIVIIPTEIDLAPQRFSGDAPHKELQPQSLAADSIQRDTDQAIREWNFIAEENGPSLISIETADVQQRRIELWQDEPTQLLQSLDFLPHNVTRNPLPVFNVPMIKGAHYRLRIGVLRNAQWSPMSWSVDPLATSASLITESPSQPLIVDAAHTEGIYDLWVRGRPSSSTTALLQRPNTADVQLSALQKRKQYQYLGKVWLDHSTRITLQQEDTVLIAIPNTHVDTYQWSGVASGSSAVVSLSSFPPGSYRLIVTGGNPNAAEISVLSGSGLPLQSLSLPQSSSPTNRRLADGLIVSNGNSLELQFGNAFTGSSFVLYLYEDIPDLQEAWSFEMSHHPLLGSTDQTAPLFLFRNIVSSDSVLRGEPKGFLPHSLGTNSLGMTLVVNPSNDFADFRAEEIDAPKVTSGSRVLSAAYLYWMRYDSALTQQNLNCDPTELLCTTKRVWPVIGLFTDPLSIFPDKPYFREGRRLIAQKTITYNDIAAEVRSCAPSGCQENCRPVNTLQLQCIPEAQTPLLFADAIAAAAYGIDVHSFVTRSEYFTQSKPMATALSGQYGDNSLSLLGYLWGLPYSKPTQIPLGALLPKENSHILPASYTIGMSQIANGLYRTHANELAIGQAVGHVLSYCLSHNLEPSALTGSVLRSFQHSLIEKGVTIYPIVDAWAADLRAPVQHLILEGLLVPEVALSDGQFARKIGTMEYRVFPNAPIDARDMAVIRLFSQESPAEFTYRSLFRSMGFTGEDAFSLQQQAFRAKILDEAHKSLEPNTMLLSPPSKGDLYRAASFLRRHSWSAGSTL